MPTVILLDVSLSMCRLAGKQDPKTSATGRASDGFVEIRQLANVGIGSLLDYFAQNAQLEYTALVIFSSLWEIKHEFTRNHESIKNGIYDLELYDKSNIVNAVRGILNLKLNEWVQNGPVNVVLVTDGQLHHENLGSSKQTGKGSGDANGDDFHDASLSELEGQFDFPCKLQLVCLTSPLDSGLKHSLPFYKQLVSMVDSSITECPVLTTSNTRNFKQSAIWLPESDSMDVSIKSVEDLFLKIAELHNKPYTATLTCGHLCSMVMLSPKPNDCSVEPQKNENDDLKLEMSQRDPAEETFVNTVSHSHLYRLSNEINICGFLPVSEIASPAVISKHLVIPIVNERFDETSKAEQILSQDPNAYNKLLQTYPIGEALHLESSKSQKADTKGSKIPASSRNATGGSPVSDQDITKQPSFCVLLLNGLKQENMVAICMIGKGEETNENWYGMLHAQNDSKKRSSLVLSAFTPSSNPVPWLPDFRTIGSSILNGELPQPIRDKLKGSARKPVKSYSLNCVIWLNPESVQADVQKVVRNSKRSPDKAAYFFKELNRIRRAAISYGFYDVLFGLAAILEREKKIMLQDPGRGPNQEMINHVEHAIQSLRANLTEDSYDINIAPKT